MSTAIRFENVSKVYRLGESRRSLRAAIARMGQGLASRRADKADAEFWALRDVSFEVARGEALGIIGPNGAGKTTILKLLSKITRPTGGRIEVTGRTSALIELGAGFHPDLTGQENIYLNAAILGLSRGEIDRKFDSIVAFSGLERFIDTPVKRYSSGMYVRLGFSVAAHVEPEVLLVDEVLAVGDAEFRQRCAERIQALRSAGTTIVFISHNLPLVQSICDRALYLERGRIRAQGNVVETLNAYEQSVHQSEVKRASAKPFAPLGPDGDTSIQIVKVGIHSLSGGKIDELLPSDPVEVCVHWRARERLAEPNLVVRFMRADGVVCSMIRTLDEGYVLADLMGHGTISLTLDPLQLTGGAYVLDARLLGALDGIPLAQAHSDWFQVEGTSLGHGESGGVYVPRVTSVRVGFGPTAGTNEQAANAKGSS